MEFLITISILVTVALLANKYFNKPVKDPDKIELNKREIGYGEMIFKGLIGLFVLIAVISLFTENNSNTSQTVEDFIGYGKVNTVADGYDVQRVNLWSSSSKDRKMTGSMVDGERVKVLRSEGEYYLIQSIEGNERRGYCMRGFVRLD